MADQAGCIGAVTHRPLHFIKNCVAPVMTVLAEGLGQDLSPDHNTGNNDNYQEQNYPDNVAVWF
jgi:hypothetical protein